MNENTYSTEEINSMIAELIKSQKEAGIRLSETDRILSEKFKETEARFKETDIKFKEVLGELSGIGKSNGAIAEEFFGNALANNMKIGNLEFDFIDFNLRRKRKNTVAEYDIVLYNSTKVIIIEVKYNFRKEYLRKFYDGGLRKFRTLFPNYANCKLYGGIAALTFEKGTIEEAEKYGFYVLSQNNDKFSIANSDNFEPKVIN